MPQLQPQEQERPATTGGLPYAEGRSLESLLQTIDTTAESVQAEQKELQQTTVHEAATAAPAPVEVTAAAAEIAASYEEELAAVAAEEAWEANDLGDEFQTLFFTVQGVKFAIPLIWLGGIYLYQKSTFLFGKPEWYMGITDIRSHKISIVDTLRFIKPEIKESPEKYKYLIHLGQSNWSLGCDVLEGNRTLTKNAIKWRKSSGGTRPFLAGIVKDEMCALLHVDELIRIFDSRSPPGEA